MPRRVFFSFHYENDIWRANQVRNSWVTQAQKNSFVDAAEMEEVKKGGDAAIKQWIKDQMHGTSVTVVLIGIDTHESEYVNFEICESFRRGNGILGIYINELKNQQGETDSTWILPPKNPFKYLKDPDTGQLLSDMYRTYDWLDDDGFNNISEWIEFAAEQAGR